MTSVYIHLRQLIFLIFVMESTSFQSPQRFVKNEIAFRAGSTTTRTLDLIESNPITQYELPIQQHSKSKLCFHIPEHLKLDKVLFAKLLGYAMGAGALLLYFPIIMKLIQQGNSDGFSTATWIYSLFGHSLALAYPMKKKFPLTTYSEILGSLLQIIVILGITSVYLGKLFEYFMGIMSLGIIFYLFQTTNLYPQKYLGLIQILATIIGNYANVPQIILAYRTKQTSWSAISAFLAVVGSIIRIFTTLQLTRDPFVLGGYVLGVVTNSILLFQIYLYRSAKV